jgi:hypothetical protein
VSSPSEWSFDSDSPHIAAFQYELATLDDSEQHEKLGSVDGYRIAQDWTIESDLQLWDESGRPRRGSDSGGPCM